MTRRPAPAEPDRDEAQDVVALRERLREAEEILAAIRSGSVDSLVVGPPGHERVFSLTGADRPYRLIVESLNEGAAAVSGAGVILHANPRLTALAGRPPGGLTGADALDLVVAGDRRRLAELLDVGPGQQARAELELDRGQGPAVPVLVSVSAFDLDDTVLRSVVVADLTARRAAEEAVSRAAAEVAAGAMLYRSVVAALGEGLVVHGADGSIVECNEAAEHILGLSADQLTGRTPTDPRWRAVHADGSPFPGETHPATVALTTREAVRDVVMGVQKPDGTLTWILVNAIPLPVEAGAGAVVASFTDITAERAAAQALRAAGDRLRATLDAGFDPQVLLTPVRENGSVVDFAYADANAVALRVLRVSDVADLRGRRISDVVPGPEGQMAIEYCRQALARGEPTALDGLRFPLDAPDESALFLDYRLTTSQGDLLLAWRDVTERYAAARALAVAEQHYRRLAENASDVVVESDTDGAIVWVSPSVEQVLGWRPEAVVGRRMAELVHPDDLPAVRRRIRQTLADDAVTGRAQFRVATADGGWRWMADTGRALLDDQGTVTGGVDALRDIDGEVAARAALAAAEEMYRMLAENASDVVFRAGPDRRITWVSPTVTAVLGYPVDAFLGTRLTDYMRPGVSEALAEDRAAFYSGRDPSPPGGYTFELRTRSGDYRWFSGRVRPLTGAGGGAVGAVAGLRDVTDVVAAQRAADAGRAQLQATLDTMLDPHAFLEAVRDDDDRIVDLAYVDANRAALAYLGRERDGLVGHTILELFPGHAGAGLLDQYRDVLDTGRPLAVDGFAYDNELVGPARRYDIRAVKVGPQLSVTWRDVTERHAAAAALAEREERLRQVLDSSTDIVLDIGSDQTCRWASPSVQEVLGWSPEELVGRTGAEFIHPDDLPAAVALRRSGRDGVADSEFRVRTSRGSYQWVAGRSREIRDADGAVKGRVVGLRDVQAEHEARETLARAEREYRILAENASDVVLRTGPDSALEWVSPSVVDVLGYSVQELVGTNLVDLVHPDDVAVRAAAFVETADTEPVTYEARFRTSGGDYRWLTAVARPVFDADGVVIGRVGSMRDSHDEHLAREALAASEARFRLAMAAAPVGMAVVDLDRRFVQVNPALCRMLDRDEAWLLAHRVADVVDPADDAVDLRMRADVLSGRAEHLTREKRFRRADGSTVWVQHAVSALRDADGRPVSYVSQVVDVTDARKARETLRFMATHDPLTRLVNRTELLTQMDRILSHPPRTGTRIAVLFIDLDGLKPVNDHYGHAAGDAVIVAVADRISGVVRSDDLVARIGGDEFVAALPAIRSLENAGTIAAKIHEAVALPIDFDGELLHVSVSIGIAVADPGDDPESTIHHADAALYRAKALGRAQTVTHDPTADPAC